MKTFFVMTLLLLFISSGYGKEASPQKTILLDTLEVKIKKRDVGEKWDDRFYLSSQFIGFPLNEGPNKWNKKWHEEQKTKK